MKKILAIVVVLTLLASLAGCAAPKEEQGKPLKELEEIKIGLIAPTSGEVAVYGQSVLDAVKMAEEEINAAGGIDGVPIKIITYDNKGDSTESINVFNKLVSQDKVVSVIGPVISGTSLSVAPEAEANKVVMLSPTATNLDVTPSYDYVFRACYIDPYQGGTVAKFAAENLGVKTAAILYDSSDDYSTGLATAFEEVFTEAGGEILNFEGFGKDDVDFNAILTKINKNDPDVIFIPTYYEKVGLIVTQIKDMGIDATLLGGDGWDGVQGQYMDVVEGSYFANHYAADDEDPIVQAFVKNYTEKYDGTPNALAALGYDAAYLTVEAIKKAGTTSSSAILEAMQSSDYDGVTGHIKFDEEGNPIKSISMITIKDGKLQLDSKVSQ